MESGSVVKESIISSELYFLISKFLSNGPLRETAKILVQELEEHKVLPKRIDWQGQEHEQTFAELENKYSHIGPQHLLEICCRISPILDREVVPSIPGILSLLGAGRQSLLRTKESVSKPPSIVDYCTRLHYKPLSDPTHRKSNHNLVKVLFGRECSGPIERRLAIPPSFYDKQMLLKRTLGHLSAVYCVLFDRTGKYILTGADDLLVKLWSAIDGRLLVTFRGAAAEITDIAINLDNSLLAAGSLDRIIRVWDLVTAGPVAVLSGHTGCITSVNFCPSPRGDMRYLVSTSTDGSVAFWQYTTQRGGKTVFPSKPISYHEKIRPGQAQMICASFSPGGLFLATGSADHYVRVYIMSEDGPKRIIETEAHSDTVDSIQWAHSGLRFISGSKDGTAHVWHFESQQWKSIKLNMIERLPSCPRPSDEAKKLKVTMVSWDYSDRWVITADNDYMIKVWNPGTGALIKVLQGHTDELYVLESHPKDTNVLLSAGHDGHLFIWNIQEGVAVASFVNHIEGQGHGGVFDAKWSPDGTMIAATDSHGHILVFGFGVGNECLKMLPKEIFFHTDYRPLIRDANNYVMDEQTQTMPHLMPPPFLVDVDGNPHPPAFQRLVPGRENCPSEQLIPNISVGPEGVEVMEDGVRSDLDRLIEALANRHGPDQARDSNNERENSIQNNRSLNNNSPRAFHRIGLRRTGDVEGVRQSSGNWQRDGSFKFMRRVYVRPLKYSQLQTMKTTVYTAGLTEMEIYRRELRRRPMMINTASTSGPSRVRGRRGRLPKNGVQPAYRTRAVREREHVEEEHDEEPEHSESSSESSDSTAGDEDLQLSGSESTDDESSDYSDWIADQPGENLEPPKRSKRKPVQKRAYTPENEANRQSPEQQSSRGKKVIVPPTGEIPEAYRTPEWLSEVIPRKAPYYPQMGDEVVYLRQGHERYLDAVRAKNVYKLSNNSEPWSSIDLREHEICKVIGIKYEIRPPRLCCLKLGVINRDGILTGSSFTIKYHDMPDVLDFLVLRQMFDTAVSRNWTVGDRFRCMIDDGWWMGEIESRVTLSSTRFPNSLFMCFRVRWDNGEYEHMSPWDLEPIDENRLPAEVGGAVHVLPEELRATLYQPKPEEWPRGDREASCRRIVAGFEHVMGLGIADLFLAPVDLNRYPGYAFQVEYPIDLSTIKARFENHFYRRITSAQFDVRYLATNAEKFNKPHSNIVKNARIITDLCLRIMRDPCDIAVGAVYHQLVDTYISSDSDNEENQPGPSTSSASNQRGTRTRRSAAGASSSREATGASRRSKRLQSVNDWRIDCRELLDIIWQCEDSTPFREPVDIIEHSDYNQVIDTPMDLMTVKEDLLGGNYENPLEFAKDMRLIFQNSRNYNTNKRSQIYSMTLRLSQFFEAKVKPLILSWKLQLKRSNKKSKNKKAASKLRKGGGGAGGSGVGVTNGNHNSSDDDDDDDDSNDDALKKPRGRPQRRRNNQGSGSNTVTSSVNNDPMPGPSQPRRAGGRTVRNRRGVDSDEMDHKSESHNSDHSGSSSSDDDSDGSNTIPLAALGDGGKQRALAARKNRMYDSGDSYKPNQRHKKKAKKSRRTGKVKHEQQPTPTKSDRGKRKRYQSSEDNDHEQQSSSQNGIKKRARTSNENSHFTRSQQPSTQSYEDQSSDNEFTGSQRSRRARRYESDQSYHMDDGPSTRRSILESESDNDAGVRPTRGSTRRAQLMWGRETDSLEEPNDDDQHSQQQDTRNRNSNNSNSSNNLSQSHRRRRGRRKSFVIDSRTNSQEIIRITNNRGIPRNQREAMNLSHEDENHHHVSDNEPGPSTSRGRSSRVQRSFENGPSPSQPSSSSSFTTTSRRAQPQPPSSQLRNQSSLVDSSHNRSRQMQPHQVDHNYGEPGPSTLRTRRMLSRHQRNIDGIDEIDPLLNEEPTSSSRRIKTNRNDSERHSGSNIRVMERRTRGRGNFSEESLENEEDDDEENGDGDVVVEVEEAKDDEDKSSDSSSGIHASRSNSSTENDSDDTPLQMMVSSSKRNRAHNTRSGGVSKQRYFSDEEHQNAESNGRGGDKGDGGGSGGRSTRNQKRLQYNEDDSDESTNAALNNYRKRRIMVQQTNHGNESSSPNEHHNSANLPSSSNRNNLNQLNNSDELSDGEQPVSISSRGRVRKLTAKGRGLFKE